MKKSKVYSSETNSWKKITAFFRLDTKHKSWRDSWQFPYVTHYPIGWGGVIMKNLFVFGQMKEDDPRREELEAVTESIFCEIEQEINEITNAFNRE